MAVYKRGGVWWYKFKFDGESVRESTKQTNKRVAEQMEAARKTSLAKGEVGLEDKKCVPTLKAFGQEFIKTIETRCAEKPATISFYKQKLKQVLEFSKLASARLDRIDEALIESYAQRRTRTISRHKKALSPASVNRELATLRRLLRLASEWRLIGSVPRIRLLRGERNREFVLGHADEKSYLSALKCPLRDVATILLDTGLRVGEILSLEWTDVHLRPAKGAKHGYLTVRAKNAKNSKARNIPLTDRVAEILRAQSPERNGYIFHRPDGSQLYSTWLDQQHSAVRESLKLPKDFVLHSLRHTFGTRLGEAGADAFTIMRLMGHSTVTVSQRYVHPSPESMENAVSRLEALNRSKVQEGGTKVGTVQEAALGPQEQVA